MTTKESLQKLINEANWHYDKFLRKLIKIGDKIVNCLYSICPGLDYQVDEYENRGVLNFYVMDGYKDSADWIYKNAKDVVSSEKDWELLSSLIAEALIESGIYLGEYFFITGSIPLTLGKAKEIKEALMNCLQKEE